MVSLSPDPLPLTPLPGTLLILLWVTKKKALAVMQRIYIDNERWKSQEKLLALESLTHYNIFECPGQAS